MDWAGQTLQANDLFYALGRPSLSGHLRGSILRSALAQLRSLRSDQLRSGGSGDAADAAALQGTVLEQHFSLGLLGGGFWFHPIFFFDFCLRKVMVSKLLGMRYGFSLPGCPGYFPRLSDGMNMMN